jgi:hypothetical protein
MKSPFFHCIILVAAMVLWQCVYRAVPSPSNCDINPVLLQSVSIENTDCGLQDGRFQVAASGGTGVYRYKLDNEAYQPSTEFSKLSAGNHIVTALDENNCSDTLKIVIKNKNGVNIDLQAADAGCKTVNGSITATAVSGIGPYTFKINGGEFQSGNTFTNLSQGEYSVIVKDSSGCEAGQSVKIKSGISFTSSILPIIQKSCTISGCHNGSQFPDLRVFKNIQDNAARIKTQTASRSMPLGGALTQSEIDAIACWVDDGAPQN